MPPCILIRRKLLDNGLELNAGHIREAVVVHDGPRTRLLTTYDVAARSFCVSLAMQAKVKVYLGIGTERGLDTLSCDSFFLGKRRHEVSLPRVMIVYQLL